MAEDIRSLINGQKEKPLQTQVSDILLDPRISHHRTISITLQSCGCCARPRPPTWRKCPQRSLQPPRHEHSRETDDDTQNSACAVSPEIALFKDYNEMQLSVKIYIFFNSTYFFFKVYYLSKNIKQQWRIHITYLYVFLFVVMQFSCLQTKSLWGKPLCVCPLFNFI